MGAVCLGQTQGNYLVIINNDSINIKLNNNVQYKTTSGEKLTIRVIQPDILTYSDDFISFKLCPELNPLPAPSRIITLDFLSLSKNLSIAFNDLIVSKEREL